MADAGPAADPPAPGPRRVLLVRHGEAEHNATKNWKLVDPALTERGRGQAQQLQGHELLRQADVVIVSPLRRALQTALLVYGADAAARLCELSPLCAERYCHVCDVGRPKSEIVVDTPEIAAWRGFQELPESWMHPRGDRKRWRVGRLALFRAFLRARPEAVVVVIGHGEFFWGLTRGRNMANCEVFDLPVDHLQEPPAPAAGGAAPATDAPPRQDPAPAQAPEPSG